jgi:hypothetical protein
MTSNLQPQPAGDKRTQQPNHDGLAAVAIALLTIALIAFAIFQIT